MGKQRPAEAAQVAEAAPPKLSKTQKRALERKNKRIRDLATLREAASSTNVDAPPAHAASIAKKAAKGVAAAAPAAVAVKGDAKLREKLKAHLQASKTRDISLTSSKSSSSSSSSSSSAAAVTKREKSAPKTLVEKMKDRLKGARFRWINEQLYTTTSGDALALFQKEPALFEEYHQGFRTQVALWPKNPIDTFIAELAKRDKRLVVADFGCGEAAIAEKAHQKVHSFDLVAHNERVIACDMAHVPLPNNEVDIAIFSLSLMGTNYREFIREAHRVLRVGGELQIAEVVSRIGDIDAFVKAIEEAGFEVTRRDEKNPMFIRVDFKKTTPKFKDTRSLPELKPCLYKKR